MHTSDLYRIFLSREQMYLSQSSLDCYIFMKMDKLFFYLIPMCILCAGDSDYNAISSGRRTDTQLICCNLFETLKSLAVLFILYSTINSPLK